VLLGIPKLLVESAFVFLRDALEKPVLVVGELTCGGLASVAPESVSGDFPLGAFFEVQELDLDISPEMPYRSYVMDVFVRIGESAVGRKVSQQMITRRSAVPSIAMIWEMKSGALPSCLVDSCCSSRLVSDRSASSSSTNLPMVSEASANWTDP